ATEAEHAGLLRLREERMLPVPPKLQVPPPVRPTRHARARLRGRRRRRRRWRRPAERIIFLTPLTRERRQRRRRRRSTGRYHRRAGPSPLRRVSEREF
ncbi:unnamed protein product, partial [Ectocarpus fasciculatus]